MDMSRGKAEMMERFAIDIVDGACICRKTGKHILCVDFDGVLHTANSIKWTGVADAMVGDPVPGSLEFINEAVKSFRVIVHSTRCSTSDGREGVSKWLAVWGFPALEMSDVKPPFHIHIDDRTYAFSGIFPSIIDLQEFRPWWHAPT